MSRPPSISVVVCSYRRPDELRRCLVALEAQKLSPAEVIVVRRTDDRRTARALAEHDRVSEVIVSKPGVLAAMRAGASAATAECVAFFDDDAEPASDWLHRAADVMAREPDVGGFGGRDIVRDPDDLPRSDDVGRITQWGKMIGDHHRGTGRPRDVDVLKAADMMFRRAALTLPTNLRGSGAQVHFEIATCLTARQEGWRLRYDPGAVVQHLPGARFDADQRGRPAPSATRDAAYNLVFCLGSTRRLLLRRRAAYGLLVGDRGAPGLLRAAVAVIRGDLVIAGRLWPSLRGQLAALLDLRRNRCVDLVRFPL